MPEPTPYPSEAHLVEAFHALLIAADGPWSFQGVAREFNYQRGRADLVAAEDAGHVVAFEAKLLRWREALHQAYRNRCFAHRSFVVLPPATAARAALYPGEFELRGVGLCTVRDGVLNVLLDAPADPPVQPWLTARAHRAASASSD